MRKIIASLCLTLLASVACSGQSASTPDEVAAENSEALVQECRTTTKECLAGAISVTDIKACRGIFKDCVGDLVQTTDDVLVDAIDVADQAIDITLNQATGLIDDVLGAGTIPKDLAKDCRTAATGCLKGVVTLSDITACQKTFDACIKDATSLGGIGIQVGGVIGGSSIGISIGSSGQGCSIDAGVCIGAGKPPSQCALGANICLRKQ